MTPPSPTPPKLLVDGLTKRYGAVVALEATHLAVAAGEFLTLLGPSGSGKTTLLQMICGLTPPSGGRILVDGRDETDLPVHKRDLALVFQHYALFPHLTVAENVAFPLQMRTAGKARIAGEVEAALAMVQLEPLADRFPRELSGGQQQRVALARCFVYRPSVILMDEPLGALDKKLREHMQLEIKRLHRESGTTIVYVTHDQEEALALSDRICLMNHARVEQVGTPQEIYSRPRTAFAADFIGLSTIFRGRVEANGGGSAVLATGDGRFHLPEPHPVGAEAALVVRPEQFELGTGQPNRLAGMVVERVYVGAETRLLLQPAGGGKVTVRLPAGETPPDLGTTVTVGWRPDCAVLLP